MVYIKHTQRGTTLIEVILYAATAAVMVGILAVALLHTKQSYTRARVITNIEEQGMHVQQTLTRIIRNAQSVTSPGIGASDDVLRIEDRDGATVIVSVDSGVLMLEERPGDTYALTGSELHVSGIAFTNASESNTPGAIRVEFTLSSDAANSNSTYTYERIFTTSATLYQ